MKERIQKNRGGRKTETFILHCGEEMLFFKRCLETEKVTISHQKFSGQKANVLARKIDSRPAQIMWRMFKRMGYVSLEEHRQHQAESWQNAMRNEKFLGWKRELNPA